MIDPETATLARQYYDRRPCGVWLECTACPQSQVIAGSNSAEWVAASDEVVAKVFRRHGWTGQGDRMLQAKCPKCSR